MEDLPRWKKQRANQGMKLTGHCCHHERLGRGGGDGLLERLLDEPLKDGGPKLNGAPHSQSKGSAAPGNDGATRIDPGGNTAGPSERSATPKP